jgi:hypothetical protein
MNTEARIDRSCPGFKGAGHGHGQIEEMKGLLQAPQDDGLAMSRESAVNPYAQFVEQTRVEHQGKGHSNGGVKKRVQEDEISGQYH